MTGERRAGPDRRKVQRLPLPARLGDVSGWIALARQTTYLRYLVVSLCALGIDLGCFVALIASGLSSVFASAIAYSIGIIVHWTLSSRKVFQDRVSEPGSLARNQQKAMFLMSALLGLVVTMAIVAFGEWIGVNPVIAKIVAVGVSFQLTYVLRNIVIFRAA
jgi:putative flippase GtrA